MMHFKFGEKWFQMPIKHYDTIYTEKLDKCQLKIHGKVYIGQSPELEKALDQERMWEGLKK